MSASRDVAPLTARLSARILRPGSGSLAARIHLTYEPADPYAVLMEIRVPGGKAVNWLFGRELLAEGTHVLAGIGDVTVQPCPEASSDLLHMTLRNEASDAVLEMRLAPIDEFLRSSYGLVPAGREGMFLEVDDDVRTIAS